MVGLTVSLEAEDVLTITNTSTDVVTVRRSSNTPGLTRDSSTALFNNISIQPGIRVEIGPFTSNKRYVIDSAINNFTHSVRKEKLSYNHQGTGVLTGGLITVNSGDNTKWDLSAGIGTVVDNYTDPENPNVVHVEWPAYTALDTDFLNTDFVSFVTVDINGNIGQQDTRLDGEERRDLIALGLLIHSNLTNLTGTYTKMIPGYDQAHALVDLSDALNIVNKSGNIYSANGANLKVDKSAGKTYFLGGNYASSSKSPNISTDPSSSGASFFDSYRNGTGGWAPSSLVSVIDPTKYDDGSGTLSTMAGIQNFQIMRIFYAPNIDDTIIAYGQQVYLKMADAMANLNGEIFEQNPVLDDTILRGYLIVNRTATDLTDTTKAKFIALDKLGGSAAGGSSAAASTLQSAYENSGDALGEILTNATNQGLTIRDGTNDADNLLYCGRNYANVHVYGVNGYGQVKGSFLPVTTAGRPGSPRDYQFYFDTTLGIPIWYDGTNWVNAAGTTV